MVFWSTRQEWVKDTGWFADKICVCPRFRYKVKGAWDDYSQAPVCAQCGLWANRLAKCPMCHERFYVHFTHPRTGHHWRPVRGWYCWNCLEKYMPPVVESTPKSEQIRHPPPAEVLPPGYELYVPRPIVWG